MHNYRVRTQAEGPRGFVSQLFSKEHQLDVAEAPLTERHSSEVSLDLCRDEESPLQHSDSICRVFGSGSGVHAPVDGVEEQVGQREGQSRVRVDHVAVVDQQVHVFTYRPLTAKQSPLRGAHV